MDSAYWVSLWNYCPFAGSKPILIVIFMHQVLLKCCFELTSSLPFSVPGDSLGRLWTNGPQMFYGCSTDPIGGAGPLQHGDQLVQTVSAVLIGGPYISSAQPAGISDVIGHLRTATGRSVLVTEWWTPHPPKYPFNDKNNGPELTGPELSRGARTRPHKPLGPPMRGQTEQQGMRARTSERERQN